MDPLDEQLSVPLRAAALDALVGCIAIVDPQGVLLAANASWSLHEEAENLLVHRMALGTDYAAYCRDLAARAGSGLDDLAAVARGFLEVLETSRGKYANEYRCGEGTGTRWYGATIFSFPAEGRRCVGIAIADISRRKETEEKLRRSEDLLRLITENVVDGMALVDPGGRLLYTSPSYGRGLGYTDGDLARMAPLAHFHPEDVPSFREALDRIAGTGQETLLTYRVAHKDGGWRTFEAHVAGVPDSDGSFTRMLVVARDVTERLKAEREAKSMEIRLRQAQKLEAIGQLAAGIAHEINTPIQYVGDNTRFLEGAFRDVLAMMEAQDRILTRCVERPLGVEGLEEVGRVREEGDAAFLLKEIPKAVAQSLDGVARVARIVRAMKAFSHPGGDEPTPVDLNAAVESTLTVSRNEWKYVAELRMDLDPNLPQVVCLPGEVNQVVLNLVVNAAHAIADANGTDGAKGLITVATRRDGDWAEIRVGDTGTGIPEHVRSRIFDPFFTTKAVGRGSGQGLSIAHGVIVDKHHGTIEFETEMGRGTTFVVRLPFRGIPG
jgi:two-component system, NtrC family, sensor kinase